MEFRSLGILCCASQVMFACASSVKIPVVTATPAAYATHMQGVKTVMLAPLVADKAQLTREVDWNQFAMNGLKNALAEQRFFVLLESAEASAVLRQYAPSELPRPVAEAKMGKQLGVDAFLYYELTGQPQGTCSTTSRTTYTESCYNTGSLRICNKIPQTQYTSILTTKQPVRAKLVNNRTGRLISFANSVTSSLSFSGSSCGNALEGVAAAIVVGGREISHAFSPTVTDFSVPLDSDANGVAEEKIGPVKELLKAGIHHAEKQEFRPAREKWTLALEISDKRSPASHWNLAVYFWMSGDYKSAERHFAECAALDARRISNDTKHASAYENFKEQKKQFESSLPGKKAARSRKG